MPGGWPQNSSHYDGHPSLSLSLSLTHIHSCTRNWFGDNCTQHICDKVIEDGEAPLCENEGTCLVNPSNISDYLCSCPLGFTGRNCQYKTHGGMCTCMHTCHQFNTCIYQNSCAMYLVYYMLLCYKLNTVVIQNWLWVGVYLLEGGRLYRLGKVIGFNCQLSGLQSLAVFQCCWLEF